MCSECGNEYSIKEYEELQAENEKLKCLALHAMREYFRAMSAQFSWREAFYEDGRYLDLMERYNKLAIRYYNDYRKAKKELMEGK